MAEKRSILFGFHVKPSESKMIEKAVEQSNKTKSEFLRDIILEKVKKENRLSMR